ncbi:MAG: alpha-amylase family glycosyl hydrolase [cyanobacterium endosymbiont of Rhopalodia inflata]
MNYLALPQFNHNNPAVRECIIQAREYWLYYGIDRWRLDIPNSVKLVYTVRNIFSVFNE